ncbi:hypothetical protein [uncultured Vibrio sp.]|uniref:hypothetical protein n=1 Tax=uncultured Vibrio sp. TaxID=114054 RepID=UPI002619F978|nr:hypothetical protein [uncultured Vibrio sp.]
MGKDEQIINVPKELVLRSLNQHLRRHPDFQKGIRVDDIQDHDGRYSLTPNFCYGGKSKAENYEIAMKILREIFKS